MIKLYRGEKIGEGTYGTVYSATKETPNKPIEVVAVKRNFKDLTASFIGNIRELDALSRLKGHPFIVDLQSVSFGEPFNTENSKTTPIRKSDKSMRDDKVHFVMGYVPMSLNTFIISANYNMSHAKLLMAQLLLGCEWMHAKGVSHRDFKPGNILVDPAKLYLKICDFGMSQILTAAARTTPGVMTSWYRAPEICCSSPYTLSADMWSIGCILFEMVSGWPFLYSAIDTNEGAFNAILGRLPESPDQKVIQRLFDTGKMLQIRPEASPIRRKSFFDQLKLSAEKLKEFNKQGSIEEFIDLLSKILVLDSSKRLSAADALNHSFFTYLRSYIDNIRKTYKPEYPTLPIINIIQCVERQFMINAAFSVYNNRSNLSWYNHRILFHAIDLFDRYIEWGFNNMSLAENESSTRGRLHSKIECELRFYGCLYLFHKYYATMTYPIQWDHFASQFTSYDMLVVAEEFEVLLIRDVTQFEIYRDTLLEMPQQYGQPITEELVHKLIYEYGIITSWKDASIRSMYRKIFNIPVPL